MATEWLPAPVAGEWIDTVCPSCGAYSERPQDALCPSCASHAPWSNATITSADRRALAQDGY